MRIIIACLALMLIAGPVMACSYDRQPSNTPVLTLSEKIADDDTVFFGKVVEITAEQVTFKVISSRSIYRPGELVRVQRHIQKGICDYPIQYNLGEAWIHSARGEDTFYTYTTTSDLGEDNGQNFEELIKRFDIKTQPNYMPPPTRIINAPLFKHGDYTLNSPCSANNGQSALTTNYLIKVTDRRNHIANDHLVMISKSSCVQRETCKMTEYAPAHGDGIIIVTPIGQTACSLTLTQTAEGVTVQENDRAACAAALSCSLPNGFNTIEPLQPTADTLRMWQEQINRVRGNNSFMPTPLPPPQPKAE